MAVPTQICRLPFMGVIIAHVVWLSSVVYVILIPFFFPGCI